MPKVIRFLLVTAHLFHSLPLRLTVAFSDTLYNEANDDNKERISSLVMILLASTGRAEGGTILLDTT